MVLPYLDDFLFVVPAGIRVCSVLLLTIEAVVSRFGLPLAAKKKSCQKEKTGGPAMRVKFLGIIIHLVQMEYRLPDDKFEDLKICVNRCCRCKKL